jgi:hypothetical protein
VRGAEGMEAKYLILNHEYVTIKLLVKMLVDLFTKPIQKSPQKSNFSTRHKK